MEIELSLIEEVASFSEGKSFGELALITDKPRAATCVVSKEKKAVLAVLHKDSYKRTIGESFRKKMETVFTILQKTLLFKSLRRRTLN